MKTSPAPKPTLAILGKRDIELGPFAIDEAPQEAGPWANWRLRTDEDRLLRDPVRGVRLVGIAVPEVVFRERHRGELRIRADSAHDHDLRGGVQARLLEDVRASRARIVAASDAERLRNDPADLAEIRAVNEDLDEISAW